MTIRKLTIRKVFYIIAGLAMALTWFSCQNRQTKNSDQAVGSVYDSASVLLISQPGKALKLVSRIDTVMLFSTLPDSLAGLLLKLRGDAMMRLDLRDSAYRFMQWSRNKAIETERKQILVFVDFWLALNYTEDGKFYLAEKYVDEAIGLLKTDLQTHRLAEAYALKGNVSSSRGNYSEGQKYQLKAMKIFEKTGDTADAGAVLINIGNNYVDLGDGKQALSCLQRAVTIARKTGDTINYMAALNNLGRLCLGTNTDSAAACFNQVLQLNGNHSWSNDVLAARFHLAGISYENHDYTASLASYRQIFDTCQKQSIGSGIYRALSGIGNVYEAIGKDADALRSFTLAYNLARENKEARMELNLLEAILYMQKKAGDCRSSFQTLEKIRNLSDSLLAVDKQLGLHDLEMMYNIEKANIRNDELKANVVLMKRIIRSKNISLTLTVVFILSLSVLLWAIYRLYRQRDVAYRALIEEYRDGRKITGDFGVIPVISASGTDKPISALSDSRTCFEQLKNYFETEKPYLNSHLKIEDVTQALNISRKTLTNCLQEHTGTYFITFTNSYRVREALRLFASPDHRQFKIDYIAKLAGFGSKVAFYTAFTQVTGSKPGFMRKNSGDSSESSDFLQAE